MEKENITVELSAAELLKFSSKRETTNLFKEFLSILKEQKEKHVECMAKLRNKLPKEYQTYVELADYYTYGESERLRSQVLQRGNDCIRSISGQIDQLDIDFK